MGYRLWVIGICALTLSACNANRIAIDDAYHWEKKSTYKVHPRAQEVTNTTSEPSEPIRSNESSQPNEPGGPILEYVNVQDTTITVRVIR